MSDLKMKTIHKLAERVADQIPETRDLTAEEVESYIKAINAAEDKILALSEALGDMFRYGYYIGLDNKIKCLTNDQLAELDDDVMKASVVADNALALCNDQVESLTVDVIKDYLDHARELLTQNR